MPIIFKAIFDWLNLITPNFDRKKLFSIILGFILNQEASENTKSSILEILTLLNQLNFDIFNEFLHANNKNLIHRLCGQLSDDKMFLSSLLIAIFRWITENAPQFQLANYLLELDNKGRTFLFAFLYNYKDVSRTKSAIMNLSDFLKEFDENLLLKIICHKSKDGKDLIEQIAPYPCCTYEPTLSELLEFFGCWLSANDFNDDSVEKLIKKSLQYANRYL